MGDDKPKKGWRKWAAMASAAVVFTVGGFVTGATTKLGERTADTLWPVGTTATTAQDNCGRTVAERRAGEEYVVVSVSPHDEQCWSSNLADLQAGDLVDVAIGWRNYTGDVVNNVTLRADLGDDLSLVPSTTTWKAGDNDEKSATSDSVIRGGVNVGSYANGATAVVRFTAQLSPQFVPACGLSMIGVFAQSVNAPSPSNGWRAASLTFNRGC